MQRRKRPLSSTVGNHDAQVYAKGNFSIWKLRVQLVFHNKQLHSQFCTFSVTVIKISFCLSKMALFCQYVFFGVQSGFI